MTWRKGQCHRTHERAELAVTSLSCLSHQAAFRSKSHDILAFNRERGIEPRRGRGWHDDEQYYVRFCFADPAHADAFRERFGGERLTTPPPRGRARG